MSREALSVSSPETWNFVHFVSELLSIIPVVHHQTDVLDLQLEGSGDLVHQCQ